MDPTLTDAMSVYVIAEILGVSEEESEKIGGYLKNNDHLPRKVLERRADEIPDIIMTNLARLDLPEKVDCAGLKRVLFTSYSGLRAELVLAECAAAGRMSVSVNYMEPSQDGRALKSIRDQAVRIIEEDILC
jgi:hypothetical protein